MKKNVSITMSSPNGGNLEEGDIITNDHFYKRIIDATDNPRYHVIQLDTMKIDSVTPGRINVSQHATRYKLRMLDTGEEVVVKEGINIDELCKLLEEYVKGEHPNLTFDDIMDITDL